MDFQKSKNVLEISENSDVRSKMDQIVVSKHQKSLTNRIVRAKIRVVFRVRKYYGHKVLWADVFGEKVLWANKKYYGFIENLVFGLLDPKIIPPKHCFSGASRP